MQHCVDGASDSVFRLGPDGRILYANDAACARLGYTRTEMLQLSVFDIDPDCQATAWQGLWQDLRRRGALTLESRHRTADGRIFPVEISANFVKAGDTEFSFAFARDISARRQAQDALRDAEARFRQLAEHIDEVFWITDTAKSQMVYVSPAYEKIWGRSCAELYRTPRSWLDAVHPADRGRVRAAALTSQLAGTYDETYRVVRPDGGERWVRDRAFPVRDTRGEICRVVGVAKDVTEERRTALKLAFMNEELERAVAQRTVELQEANRDLESFSYSVSHDLRAPLRTIDGFSAMVLEDCAGRLDPESERRLGVVRASAVRMGQMITDMLAFARTARDQIAGGEVDMAALAREVFDGLRPTDGRNVTFTVADLPAAWGDRAMLRQVLANLLGNALKYAGGRSDPVIGIGGRVEGGEVVYSVSDNGVGFDPRYAHKLFAVFQRLHSAAEFEGTGVGLAIVKRIMDKHGGRVWADSAPDQGATFHFSLPRAPDAADRAAA